MEMPKPKPGHLRLQELAGHWEGEVSDPQRMLSKMEMSQDGATWNTLFDGRYKRT